MVEAWKVKKPEVRILAPYQLRQVNWAGMLLYFSPVERVLPRDGRTGCGNWAGRERTLVLSFFFFWQIIRCVFEVVHLPTRATFWRCIKIKVIWIEYSGRYWCRKILAPGIPVKVTKMVILTPCCTVYSQLQQQSNKRQEILGPQLMSHEASPSNLWVVTFNESGDGARVTRNGWVVARTSIVSFKTEVAA